MGQIIISTLSNKRTCNKVDIPCRYMIVAILPVVDYLQSVFLPNLSLAHRKKMDQEGLGRDGPHVRRKTDPFHINRVVLQLSALG